MLSRLKAAEEAVSAATVSAATAADQPLARAPALEAAAEETYSLKSQIFSLENEVWGGGNGQHITEYTDSYIPAVHVDDE